MEDTLTPWHIQVVAELAYRYGNKEAEGRDSYVYVRINAFASRALLDRNYEAFTLGAPAKGLLEATDSDYKSAQLIGFLAFGVFPFSQKFILFRRTPIGRAAASANGIMLSSQAIGNTE